ncbi:hypothetical protein LOCC1_G003608 [Lachnellula occidentalis]|uniref:Uncharacterized protein n=1 Tax=Lachnellula occidentalis TaxID=215460 RepID=A0A8H8S1X1_9HELO|nr:hypothetical protein LOCC1_G003608 [Lachnellula occidentalis]
MPSATGSGDKPSNPTPNSSTSTSSAAQTTSNTTQPTKTEAEEAADRLYEERIEDENGMVTDYGLQGMLV